MTLTPLEPREPADPVTVATPLEADRVLELLGRLPHAPGGRERPGPGWAFEVGEGDEAEEDRADSDLPAEVRAVMPTGETTLATHVDVLFSRPVIPLGQDGEPLEGPPLAGIEPAVQGRWRWLDVQTLRFEPADGSMPAATRYTVSVEARPATPAGPSLSGHLSTFTTAGPRALGIHPFTGETGAPEAGPRPVILLTFDQRMDAGVVRDHARLSVGDSVYPVAVVDVDDLRARDSLLARAARDAGAGYAVALEPTDTLPPGAMAELRLDPALVSTEGPIPAGRAQVASVKVRDRFAVVGPDCSGEGALAALPCDPFGSVALGLTNPVADSLLLERIRVEPEVEGLGVAGGSRLVLFGEFRPLQRYRVEVDGELTDVWGQTLGEGYTTELEMGAAPTVLRIPGAPFLALDPSRGAKVPVWVRSADSVRVEVWRMQPEAAPHGALRSSWPGARRPESEPAVRSVVRGLSPTEAERLEVDLSPALQGARGHVWIHLEAFPSEESAGVDLRGGGTVASSWVQVMPFAVGAAWDPGLVRAWAVSLPDRTPLPGVEFELPHAGSRARSGPDGMALLDLPPTRDTVLLARYGGETAFLPSWSPSWRGQAGFPPPVWFALTDRGLYRPGETVEGHGWIRTLAGTAGDKAFPGDAIDSVRWSVRSWERRRAVVRGSAPVGDDGQFHIRADLPPTAWSGRYNLELQAVDDGVEVPGWGTRARLGVEEYRRPAYEVDVRSEAGSAPLLPGDRFRVAAAVRYYDGAPLQGSEVKWRVTTRPTRWGPPGWRGWAFGMLRDGRRQQDAVTASSTTDARGEAALAVETSRPVLPTASTVSLQAQAADVDRQHRSGGERVVELVHPATRTAALRTGRRWVRVGEPVSVEVQVVDLQGEPAGERSELRVERLPEPWRPAAPDTAIRVEGLDACAPGPPVEVGERRVRPMRCTFRAREPGRYRIVAEVRDPRGRLGRTEVQLRVLSSTSPWTRPGRAELTVEADRDRYEPGDTARLMVASPVRPAEGILTVSRHGVFRARPFAIDAPGTEVRIPIEPEHAGGIWVQVDVAPPSSAGSPARAGLHLAVDADSRRLDVDLEPEQDRLAPGAVARVRVAVTDARDLPAAGGRVVLWAVDDAVLALGGYRLPDALAAFYPRWRSFPRYVLLPHQEVAWPDRPLGPGIVTGHLMDLRTGRPYPAVEARLDSGDPVVVSDGRLRLDDVAPGRHRLVLTHRGRVVMERTIDVPEEGLDLGKIPLFLSAEEPESRVLGMGVAAVGPVFTPFVEDLPPPGPTSGEVRVRTDFRPLAAFATGVELDGNGRATVELELPETLTRYRIFAVATRGPHDVGSGESTLSTHRDLRVRASPPRFLHPGDHAELPVVVQNASERPLRAEVAARTRGFEVEGPAGWAVRLPPGGRTELRVAGRVEEGGGPVDLEIVAVGAADDRELTDAAGVQVPVHPPLAPRAGVSYRALDEEEELVLPVETPGRALPGYGGVDVSLSTTLLLPLTDALRTLCLEPRLWWRSTVARIFALASLDGVLGSLRAPDLPPPEELRALLGADVVRLARYARWDPVGLAFFLTDLEEANALHALHLAAAAGFETDPYGARERARHMANLWARYRPPGAVDPSEPVDGWREAERAYLLDVGVQLDTVPVDEGVAGWMQSLPLQDLPVEGLAWLLGPAAHLEVGSEAMVVEVLRELESRALTTAATATFQQGRRRSVPGASPAVRRLLLASDRRADGVVLASLMRHDPDHPLVPKLVRGLLGSQDGSRSAGAHETAWVLRAMGAWARAHETTTPEVAVTARLGGQALGSGTVQLDSSAATAALSGPLPAPGRPVRLEVERRGRGPLFVRAGVRYAPRAAPELRPEDRGFVVTRRYEAVDDPGDVRRREDGTWEIRAGARVRSRVTLTVPSRRLRVQLADPLPGGLEVVNPALAGQGFTDDPGARQSSRVLEGPGRREARQGEGPGPWPWDWLDRAFRRRLERSGWATHVELRDRSMEAYTPYLPAGSYESTYLLRATTPGSFLVAPPRAEETEHPETFGSGQAQRVVVVAAAARR